MTMVAVMSTFNALTCRLVMGPQAVVKLLPEVVMGGLTALVGNLQLEVEQYAVEMRRSKVVRG